MERPPRRRLARIARERPRAWGPASSQDRSPGNGRWMTATNKVLCGGLDPSPLSLISSHRPAPVTRSPATTAPRPLPSPIPLAALYHPAPPAPDPRLLWTPKCGDSYTGYNGSSGSRSPCTWRSCALATPPSPTSSKCRRRRRLRLGARTAAAQAARRLDHQPILLPFLLPPLLCPLRRLLPWPHRPHSLMHHLGPRLRRGRAASRTSQPWSMCAV